MPERSNQAGSLCSESSGGRFAGCCHTPENSYINVSEPVNGGLFSQPVWLIHELLLSAYVGEFQGPLCHHKAVAVGADCGWRLEQIQHALFNLSSDYRRWKVRTSLTWLKDGTVKCLNHNLSRHIFSQMDEGVSCSSFQGFGSDGVITRDDHSRAEL